MEDQKEYWSWVGMLFFLVKHLRPDIANITRELMKANNGLSRVAYKKYSMIKYILDVKIFGLMLKPTGDANEPWEIVCFIYSNYAGDMVSKRSMSGLTIYVLVVLFSWQSTAQRSVTLSSSEAEWVVLTEAVKEVILVI